MMKIQNNQFIVLQAGNDKSVHENVESSIESLKGIAKSKVELKPDLVSIVTVNIAREKWEITQIPWAQIAMELLKRS